MNTGQTLGSRLARREPDALEEAFVEYAAPLRSFVSRYVGPHEAEDVLQRTFLDAWQHAGSFDPHGRVSSWLFGIARHRAIDTLRTRRGDLVDLAVARDLVGDDGREVADRLAAAEDVHAALRRLPDHERVVIELTYFGGLTQREIATELELPLGTVKARSSRGVRRLAALIGPDARG